MIFVALALTSLSACDAIERHPLVPSERYEPVRGLAVATAISVAETTADVAALRSEAPLPSCRRRLPAGPATIVTAIDVTMKRRDGTVGHWRLTQNWRRDLRGAHAVSREITSTRPDGRPAARRWEARQIEDQTWASIDGRFADTSREPTIPRRITDLAFADVDALLTQITVHNGHAAIAAERGICGPRQSDSMWPPLHRVGLALGERERLAWLHYENRHGRLLVEIDERWRPVADLVEIPVRIAEVDEDLTYLHVSTWIDEGVAAGWLETDESVNAALAAQLEGSGQQPDLVEASGQGIDDGSAEGSAHGP